jgi:predicted TIM-barrel fold metal-dependent hydrolase
VTLDKRDLLEMYKTMLLIRLFEEQCVTFYKNGQIRGSLHPCIGQEATAVGACYAVRHDDYMTCTYRGHGQALAKGLDPKEAMAELLGRRTGCSKGKGGLTFDLVALPRHLPYMPEVVARHPELNFVIDHMAKPPIASGDLDSWARELEEVAALPNVLCKVSGLITEATPHTWTPEELKLAIQVAVDLFGFDRLMFGGDWPVSLLASSYQQVVEAKQAALPHASQEDLAKFWGGNAARFYRLDDGV